MADAVNYITHIINIYWQGSAYQMMFWSAIIIIALMEKDRWKRRFFVGYTLIVYLGLVNPITIKIGNYIWGEESAYFARQFSLVPIMLIIAYGMVLMLKDTKKALKCFCFIIAWMVIVINGSNIYLNGTLKKAENLLKIPADVITICDTLKEMGNDPTIAAPEPMAVYVRQYDASIHMLYGRGGSKDGLSDEIGSGNPDAESIMQRCSMQGVEYVILNKLDSVYQIMENAGYTPIFETTNYYVYKVSGYPSVRYIYDDNDYIVQKRYYNEHGERYIISAGYSMVKYEYNDDERVVRELYFDENDKPIYINSEYAGVAYEYDKDGNINKLKYLNARGDLTTINNGSAGYMLTFDDKGNVIKKSFFDNKERNVKIETGYATVKYEYMISGLLLSTSYYDENGKKVNCAQGFAKIENTYSKTGELLRTSYLDAEDRLTNTSNGYAYLNYIYSETGNYTVEMYNSQGDLIDY